MKGIQFLKNLAWNAFNGHKFITLQLCLSNDLFLEHFIFEICHELSTLQGIKVFVAVLQTAYFLTDQISFGVPP